jgi:hypothetical protein
MAENHYGNLGDSISAREGCDGECLCFCRKFFRRSQERMKAKGTHTPSVASLALEECQGNADLELVARAVTGVAYLGLWSIIDCLPAIYYGTNSVLKGVPIL